MSLTAEGFERPRLPEIKTQYDALVTDALGPVNVNADSVIGQLEGIWSEGVDNLNEALQDIYAAMYPNTAEGTALDNAVAFVGLERLDASATVTTAAAYGDEGTLIPAGSIVHADIEYFSTSDVVISRANAIDVTLEVGTVAASTAYNLSVGGNNVTFTSDASATAAEIVAGLAALLNFDPLVATATATQLRVYALDGVSPFSVTADAKLNIVKRGSPVVFVASETGAFASPAGSLINIDTPVLGWDSVSNLVDGVIGRDVETDVALRLRHASSVRATGSATVESIKARMLADVDGVTSIAITENRTNTTSSGGIPAHAFEAVIVGGVNQDIANELWLIKPAGIETYGNVSLTVLDSAGDAQTVSFSRAVSKYIWMTIAVTLNSEETLPAGAADAIKQAVVAYANANLGSGDDVILQRFYGPIYSAVDGIGQLTITAGSTTTSGGTPTYSSANIPVGKAEVALFDVSRITVTGI